jgi:hypothetical protein
MNPIKEVVGFNVNEHAVDGQVGIDCFTGRPASIPCRDDIYGATLRCDSWRQTFEGCSDATNTLRWKFPGQHNNTHAQIPPMRITVNRGRNPSGVED